MRPSFFVGPLALLLVACQSGPPPLSADEAKKVTADFGGTGFIPPPRTIADITAVLNSQKPDPTKYGRYVARADAQPPAGASTATLARFYMDRAAAASEIGRVKQWIADAEEALKLSGAANLVPVKWEALQYLKDAQFLVGNYAAGITYAQQGLTTPPTSPELASLARRYAWVGRLPEAHATLERARHMADERYSRVQQNRNDGVRITTVYINSMLAQAAGAVYATEGRYAEAEREYAQSLTLKESVVRDYDLWSVSPKLAREVYAGSLVLVRGHLAGAIAQQGRFAEAEAIARTSLFDSLRLEGRNGSTTAAAIGKLADVILDSGRTSEARRLAEISLEIYLQIGADPGAASVTGVRLTIASTLAAEDKWREAMSVYDVAGAAIDTSDPITGALFNGSTDRMLTEIHVGRVDDALAQASAVAQTREQLLGEFHPDALDAQGLRAAALYAAGRRDEALAVFRAVVPRLIEAVRVSDAGEGAPILREMRLRFVLESYVSLLSELKDQDAATEAFTVADVVGRQSVQRAIAESAARSTLRDPALAELVRHEQDAGLQVNALFALLARVQAAPADQRSDSAGAGLRANIDRLRASRAALREKIEKRFPDYANLTSPQPVTVAQVQATLAPEEALIATLVGANQTFVWAIPKQGPVVFATTRLPRSEARAIVAELRKALDPKVSILGDIPPFDVALANRLYTVLLAPVEAGWRGAKKLIVVPHGPLAEVPFSLLVSRPVESPTEREGRALFSGYREVPFLVREVTVSQVPTAAAFITLRSLPSGKPNRRPFAGFGDPWFSAQQAAHAQSAKPGDVQTLETRALRLRAGPATEMMPSANLAALPRLPDTADEVRDVARTLHADLAQDVFLGVTANERQVRTMRLDDRRVVMFATHGLVPGDLDGLTQPALALTAPSVAQVDGDGLLTMEKIIGLKLDADWVVLSACNTAAGDGAGAEAVSGLGRAFFYAGARALLVTNWPVETTSARLLTTTVFQRQAQDPKLSRAEALRQSMLALVDAPGATDPATGKVAYSYAHPIFWAPFSLVGDGR